MRHVTKESAANVVADVTAATHSISAIVGIVKLC